MSDPRLPPPGWYPEPSGAEGQRWWDGTRWTEYATPLAAPPAPQVVAPVQQPQYGAYAAPYGTGPAPYGTGPAPYGTAPSTVSSDTPTDTVWVWLIVVVPVLGVLPLFFWDWRTYIEQSMSITSPLSPMEQALGPYTDPWYVVLSVAGYVLYGLSVWFAYLDRAALKRRGFARQFHWAWAFLMSIVYVIGRSVVVKRQAGRGSGPMWVGIAVYAVSIVAVFVWIGVMMAEAFRIAFESVPVY
ncbi:DUF2510 domain-containing protein [Agromyces sp. H3Y2-19a]|uniref:DUF2510 domain-containing protein n=1 Tax=Agromyces chromiiresistens TaxID=3030835 RepID=UPI0023B9EE62|nr:DUF2510 domain-containing protein [Agromyces chromiiresistens]MDF0512478.1 DUF2510 domain-containing protein [Agromyces chromiiresistens]